MNVEFAVPNDWNIVVFVAVVNKGLELDLVSGMEAFESVGDWDVIVDITPAVEEFAILEEFVLVSAGVVLAGMCTDCMVVSFFVASFWPDFAEIQDKHVSIWVFGYLDFKFIDLGCLWVCDLTSSFNVVSHLDTV